MLTLHCAPHKLITYLAARSAGTDILVRFCSLLLCRLYGLAVHIMNATAVPDILSISYDWYEGNQCDTDDFDCSKYGLNMADYVPRTNVEFQKLGLRGITLVVSSGDNGAHTAFDLQCQQPRLLAEFPGSSPFVLSVGGTQVAPSSYFDSSLSYACSVFQCVKEGKESAVSVSTSGFTSGGGFSNYSLRQPYQSAAVANYLNSSIQLPPSSYYNHTGRGYPDVSAVGHNGYIVVISQDQLVGGTSQSSPTFAAVIALLADAFKARTGHSFGFMNPILYAAYESDRSTFNDIVDGNNVCTEGGCAQSCEGFLASEGWDPVTGLGTPNYERLLKYVMRVADEVVERRGVAAVIGKNGNRHAGSRQ